MAESRVAAVSVALATAGVAVMMFLAGFVGGGQDLEDRAAGVVDAPGEVVPPPAPIEADAERAQVESTQVPAIARPRATSQPAPPIPTPRETLMAPPAPRLQPEVPTTDPTADPMVDRSGIFHPRQVVGDIRSIEFRNGFVYPVSGIGPVAVHGGAALHGEAGTEDFVRLEVGAISYGDLTGDGVDDAAVELRETRSHWTPQTFVHVYSINDGWLEDWGSTWSDYRSDGGVVGMSVANSVLEVESLDMTGSMVATTRWRAEQAGWSLAQIEAMPARSWIDFTDITATDPVELVAAPYTQAVIVAQPGTLGREIVFVASQGELVQVDATSGVGLQVRSEATGKLIGLAVAGTQVAIPADGRYIAEITMASEAEAATRIDLWVANQRTLSAPTWESRSRTAVTYAPAKREVSAQWPEFTSAAGAADLAQTNLTIRGFIDDLVAQHQVATQSCDDDEQSVYAITYRPTLISYDLVSLQFSAFTCLCESGDWLREHSLTIDLNTGLQLHNDQLIANQDALEDLWWERVQHENGWAFAGRDVARPAVLGFDHMSLTPYGMSIGTGGELVDGLSSSLSTTIPFDDLAGIVNGSFMTRAVSGADVPLPIDYSCGC